MAFVALYFPHVDRLNMVVHQLLNAKDAIYCTVVLCIFTKAR